MPTILPLSDAFITPRTCPFLIGNLISDFFSTVILRLSDLRYDETVEGALNELADLVENHLDISALSAIAGLPTR